jgi:hypothetical protein
MTHPVPEETEWLRFGAFVLVWAAILGLMGSFILWPAVVGTVLVVLLMLGVTAGMAWSITHLEED